MRQAIRAIGWATNIFWIILLFFTVTAVYSATKLGLQFGGPKTATAGSNMTVSLPVSINNGGFYDISQFNITTQVTDTAGNLISDSSTFIQVIPKGGNVSFTHNLSINVAKLTSPNLSHLLFNDSNLDVGLLLNLNYAHAIPLQISTNLTMPWGAPLANLNFGNASMTNYNATYVGVTIPLSFQNHSFIGLDGSFRIEIVDNANQVVGNEKANINVPSGSSFQSSIQLFALGNSTNIKVAHLYFETSVFDYGPLVIPIA